jgi:hypothetical protein
MDSACVGGHYDIAGIVEGIVEEQYRRHVSATPDASRESAYNILIGIWSRHDGQDCTRRGTEPSGGTTTTNASELIGLGTI